MSRYQQRKVYGSMGRLPPSEFKTYIHSAGIDQLILSQQYSNASGRALRGHIEDAHRTGLLDPNCRACMELLHKFNLANQP